VIAYYAAESRTEQLLDDILKSLADPGGTAPSGSYGVEQYKEGQAGESEAEVVCCVDSDSQCSFAEEEPLCSGQGSPRRDKDCKATKYCLRTYGSFQDVKRAIETKIFPQSQP